MFGGPVSTATMPRDEALPPRPLGQDPREGAGSSEASTRTGREGDAAPGPARGQHLEVREGRFPPRLRGARNLWRVRVSSWRSVSCFSRRSEEASQPGTEPADQGRRSSGGESGPGKPVDRHGPGRGSRSAVPQPQVFIKNASTVPRSHPRMRCVGARRAAA